jgi:hypothetical protein
MPVDEAQDFLLFFASPPRQNNAVSHDVLSFFARIVSHCPTVRRPAGLKHLNEENRRISIDAIRIPIQAKVTRTTNEAIIGRFRRLGLSALQPLGRQRTDVLMDHALSLEVPPAAAVRSCS